MDMKVLYMIKFPPTVLQCICFPYENWFYLILISFISFLMGWYLWKDYANANTNGFTCSTVVKTKTNISNVFQTST